MFDLLLVALIIICGLTMALGAYILKSSRKPGRKRKSKLGPPPEVATENNDVEDLLQLIRRLED